MRKKFYLLSLVFVVAFIGLNATIAADSFLCGDADANGMVNISDAVHLVSFIFTGGPAPNPEAAGDVDGNGFVNISDVVYLITYIFGGGPAPYCPPVTDIDGNVYQTVTIGTQVWMAENLKVTRYRNGDAIPNVTSGATWAGLSTGAYCNFNNDVDNVATYGMLYNWYAASDSRNIAPVGWHVPTDAEWKQLEMHLGISQAELDLTGYRGTNEGGKLKESGTAHWLSPNTGATNESGFTALPGALRDYYGTYYDLRFYASFYTCSPSTDSDAWSRHLNAEHAEVYRFNYHRRFGFSIRCVKD